jgi:predicted MFS family arabinose efflux permease
MTTIAPATTPAPTGAAAPGSRRHERGFWVIAYVFAVTMAFAAAPAPLYVLYAAKDGFGSFTTTLIFAAYAAGVALSLYLAGHLSDRFGRRRLVVPAVLLNLGAALIFIAAHDLGWLLTARFLCGLGVGMLTATATAHLSELHRAARPGASPAGAAVVATAANIGGLGLGPLVAGFAAQYLNAPLTTPYVIFTALLLLGIVAVALVPETVDSASLDPAWSYRPQRISVPAPARLGFIAAATLAFVGFAMFGLFTSLAPSFVAHNLGHTSHALAGVIAFVVFGSAAVSQILTSTWPTARLNAVGLTLLTVGLVLVIAGILSSTLALLIIGGVVAGSGSGISFKAAVGTVISLAPVAQRGETLAGLFLIAYLGMALPVITLGLLLEVTSLHVAIALFGTLMALLLALAAALVRIGARRAVA